MSPLFRRGPQQRDDPAAAGRAAESQRRLEAGGIPLPASERLAALREGGGAFGSDLAVEEFAVLHRLGIVPVTLVMGSSIYHHGWQGGIAYALAPGELRAVSDGYNDCRRLALDRLLEEVRTAGADAVVGLRITQGGHDWAPGAVEFIAVGTAVRLPAPLRGSDGPVLSDLSGQEYWQLCASGLRPVGIAAHTSVHYVPATWQTQLAQGAGMILGGGGGAAWRNQELRDFTAGVYAARESAMRYLSAQAAQLGGDGVVGVKLEQRSSPYRVAGLGGEREDLIVTFDVLGTVVREDPSLAVEELPGARSVLSL
ncbi:MAG TPA: heavy metal-binding domain-containing protein [Solirubrobacteraceae bacterium]|nr:heavy metal-binding domain-containing protein [Solirubrobacteraceae bacterium]